MARTSAYYELGEEPTPQTWVALEQSYQPLVHFLVHTTGPAAERAPAVQAALREAPAAGDVLPSAALGQKGGGEIVLDPGDEKGTQSLLSVFEFEVALPEDAPAGFLGSRVHVRFEHPATPLGVRAWRGLRRLFLSHFNI